MKLPFTHRLPEENRTSAASRSKPYSHAPNARLGPRALEPVRRFPFYLLQPHSAAMVHLHPVAAGPDRNNGNVVFVHGLDEHWIETWGGASTQISGPFFGRAGLPRTCRSWPSTPWNTTRTQPSGTAEPMLDLGRSVLSSCPLIGRGGLQGRDQPLQVIAVRHLAAVATRSPTARVLISCSPFGVRINVPRRKQWPPECPQLWPRP